MSGVGGKRCITNHQATTSHYLTRPNSATQNYRRCPRHESGHWEFLIAAVCT